MQKQRLDVLLVERGLVPSRHKAQAMIMAGEVLVNNNRVDKAGTRVPADAEIVLKTKPRFVSRGGDKLIGALQDFQYDVTDKICADVGASTGGFTDCLLQNGAKRVYAIDVGYGQLAHPIRTDERVIVLERTNARYMESLDEQVALVVVDASFISLRLLLPTIRQWLIPNGDVIALVKPQFEAGKNEVGKGGIVRDATTHKRVLETILTFAQESGFQTIRLTRSPITGATGNIEFLVWLQHTETPTVEQSIEEMIRSVLPNTTF